MTLSKHTENINKKELATIAVDTFRDDLSWRESLALSPISDKLNDIIMSDKGLEKTSVSDIKELGAWRHIYKIMDVIGMGFADKLLDFLKEQQKEINRVQTRLDLLKYKQSVTGALSNKEQQELEKLETPTPPVDEKEKGTEQTEEEKTTNKPKKEIEQKTNSIIMGSVATTTTGVVAHTTQKTIEKRKGGPQHKLSEQLNTKKLTGQTDEIVTTLKARIDDDTLTSQQKKSIQKTIDKFEDYKQSMGHIDDLKERKKLTEKNLLPVDVFGKLNLSKTDIKALGTLTENSNLIKQISQTTDLDEITKHLMAAGIKKPSKSLIKIFTKADNITDITSISRVLANTTHISKISKFARAVPFLDAIAMGIDVWMYLETDKQADLIKKTNKIRGENMQSRANFTLGMGVVDGVVGIGSGIALALGASGPVGWIGLGVAGVGYGVQQTVEMGYFDIVDQYTQNTSEYITQYHTTVKQAIIQATMRSDTEISMSMTENITGVLSTMRNKKGNEGIFDNIYTEEEITALAPKTLKDAYRGLFAIEELQREGQSTTTYQEYLMLNNKKSLTKEEEKKKSNLEKTFAIVNERIENRMTYINKYLPESQSTNYSTRHKQLKNNKSEARDTMENIIHDSHVFASIQTSSHQELRKKKTPEKYLAGYKEVLETKDPQLYKKLTTEQEKDPRGCAFFVKGIQKRYSDAGGFEGTDQVLTERAEYILDWQEYNILKNPQDKKYPGPIHYNYVNGEESLQNIYTIHNLTQPAKRSLSNAQKRLAGIDYKERETIEKLTSPDVGQNILYSVAHEIHGYVGDNNMMSLMQFFSKEHANELGIYYDDGRYFNEDRRVDNDTKIKEWSKISSDELIQGQIYQDMEIDTKTETADDIINKNHKKKVANIIRREKSYQTPEKKKDIEKSILSYTKQQPGSQILLPDTLVADAIKSGIGNLAHCYISYDANTDNITILGNDENLAIHIESYPYTQQVTQPLRESLSENEQKIITSIESQVESFYQIIDVEGGSMRRDHAEDLDIPLEFKRIFTKMKHNREKTKKILLHCNKYRAREILTQKQKEYAQTINNIYLGMLYDIHNSKVSDDQQTGEIMKAAGRKRRQESVPEMSEKEKSILIQKKGEITINTTNNKFKLGFKKIFDNLAKEKLQDNKNIHELFKKEETKQYATTAANLLLQVCLENQSIIRKRNGEIRKIRNNMGMAPEKIIKRRKILIKEQHIGNIEPPQYKKITEHKQPTTITKKTKEITKATNKIQQEIKREYDKDRGSQRKEITYNNKTKKLESRGYETSLTENKGTLKIKGLNITYQNNGETIRTANFINKMKKYKKDHPDAKFSIGYMGAGNSIYNINDGGLHDIKILDGNTIDNKLPQINKHKDVFIKYLNNL